MEDPKLTLKATVFTIIAVGAVILLAVLDALNI